LRLRYPEQPDRTPGHPGLRGTSYTLAHLRFAAPDEHHKPTKARSHEITRRWPGERSPWSNKLPTSCLRVGIGSRSAKLPCSVHVPVGGVACAGAALESLAPSRLAAGGVTSASRDGAIDFNARPAFATVFPGPRIRPDSTKKSGERRKKIDHGGTEARRPGSARTGRSRAGPPT